MTALRNMLERAARSYPADLMTTGNGALVSLASLFQLSGRTTQSGMRVDHDMAMALSAVYRAVWIIAMSIAIQPVGVFRRDADGNRINITDRPRYRFLRRPNPEVASSVFWATIAGHEVLTGNAFLYVVTDANRLPVEMWPIEPRRVKVGRDPETRRKVYLIDNTVSQVDFVSGGNIVHLMGLSTDGLRGLSPIEQGRESFGLSLAAEQYAASMLGRGSTPGGILTTDQELTPDQAKQASEQWEKWHKGSANAGKVAVFGKGTKWMSVQMNPQDAQLVETRKFQVADAERFFGVPPHLMFDVEKTTSWGSGIAEQGDAFVRYTLNGHTVPIEQTISDELLPAGAFIDFDPSRLLRGNFTQQINALASLVRNGYDPADALKAVGLPPIAHTGNVPVGAATPQSNGEEAPPEV